MLLSGDGVAKDIAQAIAFFHIASDHDCALATNQLARMSHQGIGVAHDNTVALRLYQAAASAGIGSAAFESSRGLCVRVGRRSIQDDGATLVRRAAALGFPQGWFALGRFYEEASEWLVTTMRRLRGTSSPETATSRLPNFASVTSLAAPNLRSSVTIGSLCVGILLPLIKAMSKRKRKWRSVLAGLR